MTTQAIETRPATLVPVVMMDETEARAAIGMMRAELEQVDVSLMSFRQRSLDFKEREGWRALGYSGYIPAIQAELGTHYSKSYLSRLLKAAEIERVLELPMGNDVSERTLRPIGDLETPDQQRAAWDRATELAGAKPPTIKHTQQAVEEIKPPAARTCESCGGHWGAPGSMVTSEGRLCQNCAAARLSSGQPFRSVESDADVRRCGHCGKPHPHMTGYGEGVIAEYPKGITLCHPCIVELLRTQRAAQAAPPALPPAPDGWVIWQNDADSPIGMRHTSGYKLTGHDAHALIAEAKATTRWLVQLAAWSVGYDGATYTATHEHFAAIAAHDLPSLAYLAWRSDVFDDDLPDDWPDEVVRGLYLAGEDVLDLAKQEFPIGRIYYLAGIEPPATTTTTTAVAPVPADGPHLPPAPQWKAALLRARACGLRLEMNAAGVFRLYQMSDGQEHDEREDWPAMLDLLDAIERGRLRALCDRAEACGATIDYLADDDARVRVYPPKGHQRGPVDCDADALLKLVTAWENPAAPPPSKGRSDWWNCGREWKAVETAINAGDQLRAARAAAALTLTIAGDATRLALSQAEKAAQLLEAEGYASVATVVRLLMGSEAA